MSNPETSVTPQADPDVVAAVRELFRERSTPEAVSAAEQAGIDSGLWSQVRELGLHLVGVPEESGGSGGTLLDAVAIVHAAGEYAAAVPVAESIHGALLLAAAGADVPDGTITVVPGRVAIGEEAQRVPYGRHADHVVGVTADGEVVLSPVDVVREGVDSAGMASDTLRVGGSVVGRLDNSVDYAALLRAAAMAGAMEATAELTRRYTSEREQFGRPVGTFQAVQQHIVTLAQMAAMSTLNAERAAIAAMRGRASFEIAAAKQVIDKNATTAARAAHQAHGAIGMTQEYRLQQLTRRLYAWRGEYGDEKSLSLAIGAAVAEHGGVHDVVTGGSEIVDVRFGTGEV
ncbi:acyl-CoA dehydrogenase [Epidermidibacterium keratini]|uniref:Acyl-CoA dehydrogenase n=1 Tax=Epidermidibacterium keratini TaxID=1891644 RepID=A0A7L4YMS8_9ACTN|nr:acyl-CoA dehydrogenase family protein [Epidermidibacterium keratini]QHC00591.1 acyl-CoA dehydrogenase [Epidermidibacterium keratini]